MNNSRPFRQPPAYDPNLLLDELLRRLELPDDEALAQRLCIGPGFISRIRRGENLLGAAMLLRISEHSGIDVGTLRRMAHDRRTEVRLEEHSVHGPEAASTQPVQRRRAPAGLVRDDPGLPANVQWT